MQPDTYSPVDTMIELAAEAIAASGSVHIRIVEDDQWTEVTEFGFVDETNDRLMTAVVAVEGDRLFFPTINIVALRIPTAE